MLVLRMGLMKSEFAQFHSYENKPTGITTVHVTFLLTRTKLIFEMILQVPFPMELQKTFDLNST